ncbi:MAG: dihydrofolate reductase [Cyclobacteriaceae bacterium]|nr:dihydrofolate reductase [Cyclobacteriaceae bacterium]
MRKVILYIASSLDGFIARKNGDIDWLEDPNYHLEDEDYGYYEFYNSIDTTLMGNKTYQQVLGFDVPFPYPGKTNYVFSRSQTGSDENVQFVNADVSEFVKSLKQGDGKDIWLVGGGELNSILLSNGLIDKIILTMIPVKLGEGIPLFSGNVQISDFEMKGHKSYPNGFVQHVYAKKPYL